MLNWMEVVCLVEEEDFILLDGTSVFESSRFLLGLLGATVTSKSTGWFGFGMLVGIK